jgi:hypothetical protein
MLHSIKTAILSLQTEQKAFPFIETQNMNLSTSLEKFYIQSPFYAFLYIKAILYKAFLFNLAQFSLIIDHQKQVILDKPTCYLHLQLEYYKPKNRTRTNFPKNGSSLW